MQKKLFYNLVIIGCTALAFSACTGSELIKQAVEHNTPQNKSKAFDDSQAPLKELFVESHGYVMSTRDNKPVYTYLNDSNNRSTCYGECAENWPPVLVDSIDDVSGNFSAFDRGDGTFQVQYKDEPLYSYVADEAEAISGDGAQGLWEVVVVKANK